MIIIRRNKRNLFDMNSIDSNRKINESKHFMIDFNEEEEFHK